MRTWKHAKLYGGELDGAEFELDFDPPPEFLYILPLCDNCGKYHHAPADQVEPLPGCQTYKLKRIDKEALVAHYNHADLDVPGPGGISEEIDRRELVGV